MMMRLQTPGQGPRGRLVLRPTPAKKGGCCSIAARTRTRKIRLDQAPLRRTMSKEEVPQTQAVVLKGLPRWERGFITRFFCSCVGRIWRSCGWSCQVFGISGRALRRRRWITLSLIFCVDSTPRI